MNINCDCTRSTVCDYHLAIEGKYINRINALLLELKLMKNSIEKSKEESPNKWLQGYVCAVATLQRLDGNPPELMFWTTDVKELARSGGCDTLKACKACKDAGVDPYDIAALFGEEANEI